MPRPPQGAAILARAEKGETSRLVLRSVWMCHYPRILAALCLQLFYSGVQFAGPMLLNQIVKFITQPEQLQTVSPLQALSLGGGGGAGCPSAQTRSQPAACDST